MAAKAKPPKTVAELCAELDATNQAKYEIESQLADAEASLARYEAFDADLPRIIREALADAYERTP